jgi:NADPH:quinone reductase-like Zn-dependent oxidoreductase
MPTQVIDYQEHAPIHQYLSAQYSDSPFCVAIDAYGIQELYTHCAKYLSPRGPFVTVGVAFKEYGIYSMFQSVSQILWNILWPRILGGVEREYAIISATADPETMGKLAEWVEKGKLKVVVDSCWDMEDVSKESSH